MHVFSSLINNKDDIADCRLSFYSQHLRGIKFGLIIFVIKLY